MNKENIAKLVAALRSGKYEQTVGVLRDSGKYCCLGVACDISGLGHWDEKTPSIYIISKYDKSNAVLPAAVAKYFFNDPQLAFGPRVSIPRDDWGEDSSLLDHNDSGATFVQIADALENKYLV